MTIFPLPKTRPIVRALRPGSTVTIGSTSYAAEASDHSGTTLRRLDEPTVVEYFTWEDIALLRANGRWRYTPPPAHNNTPAATSIDLTLLAPSERSRIAFMGRILTAIHDLECQGRVTLTDAGLAKALGEIVPKLTKGIANQQFPGRHPRFGDHVVCPQPPSTRSIRRHYRKFVRSGLDLRVLARKRQFECCTRYFDPEVEELIQEGIREFGKQGGSDARTVATNTRGMIKKTNAAREANGLPALTIPSLRTIERRIAKLDPFEMTALREGIDAARKKFASSGLGIQEMTQFPGERIEIDEWEVDLRTYFSRIGLLRKLPRELRDQVPQGRRWLYAIIDCATRCILALLVVDRPSAEAAMRALRMASVDKTDYARAIGAQSLWSFCAGFSIVCADTGAAFVSTDFSCAVNSLHGTLLHPPVKIPEMRAHNERFFGNLSQNLMPHLSGRTFHNPVARGDYPTEERTALDDEDLTRVLSLYVIDYYHNRPHRSLNGQTPASRWRELEEQFAVSEPADIHTLRAALGVEFSRIPSKKGIELFSHHYSCEALRHLWAKGRKAALRVKADPADIGAISIEIDGKWETAEAVSAKPLYGVSLSEWTEKFRAIKQRHAHEAELSEPIRTRAVEEIFAIDKAARIRAGVLPGEPSHKQIQAIQANLFNGTSFRTGPAILETPADDFFGQRITLPEEHFELPQDTTPIPAPTGTEKEQFSPDETGGNDWGFDDE
ncbi:Integrase core domain [Aliiroseovarius crassostreae]|uniref:Integrase catalytic domain-containing protein n=2 Tax=Aliiroseovarius crassostreae TaxID=154981 RepID=A0A0P7IKS9_9RHOB|nr:hypothetical protein AKJ29_05840 [Aliiroseovarius crassostreae]SFU78628.1 Integrase core domain [Aliiroseovarius crassostreae]